MELRVPHMLHLFNVFRENKDSNNCAQLLEEECTKNLALDLCMMSMIAMLLVLIP